MPEKKPSCVHCGGSLIRDGDEIKCLSCSRIWKTNQEKAKFYEEHKADILKDTLADGQSAVTKKWGIPSATISLLIKRWTGQKDGAANAAAAAPASDPLPPLPPFNDKWGEAVQCQWFETFRTLIETSLRRTTHGK